MHVRFCDCDGCLPGAPAPVTTVHPTEPGDMPMWRRRMGKLFDQWQAEREERRFVEMFKDPEARKRAENAQCYLKRKLASSSGV